MSKFDLIRVGDKAEIKHTLTQQDVERFVELTGDDNRLHTDEEYALTTSFKKPVAHGMLGASFISTVIGTELPGDGALWYAQSLEFLCPVRVGDELCVTVEVIKKINRLKVVELRTDIYNQYKEKVTTGVAKVKIVGTVPLEVVQKATPNKSVLVVGGTGGIGSATCMQLAEDGFDVAIHYFRNKKRALLLKNAIEKIGKKAVIVSGDITCVEDVMTMKKKATRALGKIATVINCSTMPVASIKFDNLKWENMQDHFDAAVKGSYNLVRVFAPEWEEEKFGKFIAISSLATEKPNAQWLPYITSKTALNGFIKALAIELAPKGIRMNLVSPGMVDTPLISNIPEKARLLAAAQTPLRTLASPEDVSGTISFLASEKANYLTGETIRVNGGQFML
jgi:3-oxoacyl-[acyl-carrier protein] reductase